MVSRYRATSFEIARSTSRFAFSRARNSLNIIIRFYGRTKPSVKFVRFFPRFDVSIVERSWREAKIWKKNIVIDDIYFERKERFPMLESLKRF